MKVNLSYGRHGLDVEVPDENIVEVFRTRDMPLIERPVAKVRECLENPVAGAPLSEIAANRQSACIVVSDITRPVPNRVLLPPVLETLEQAGIPSQRIRLLIATGIHRPPTREELLEMLGDEIPGKYNVTAHNARDPSSIVRLGYTSKGTPIDINRLYMESKLKVATGLVEPHFMAGYSGGRKSIAIGLTSLESVRRLHGTEFLEDPGARNCELTNNPLHSELTEMALTAGADFCLNAVIDAGRRVGGIFAGELVRAHRSACEFAERHCTIHVEKPFDVVLTTAAGYPLDTTYYQAIKGIVGALGILSPVGAIVLAAECSKGLGSSEFRRVLQLLGRFNDYDEFLAHLSVPENFVIDQWEVEMLVKALRRGSVYLFSTGLAESDWPITYTARIKSVEEGLSCAMVNGGRNARIAIIPEGPYLIPLSDALEA